MTIMLQRLLDRRTLFQLLLGVISFAGAILLWRILSPFGPPQLMPSPMAIATSLARHLVSPGTWHHLAVSVALVTAGYALSLLLAFPTAALWSRIPPFSLLSRPFHEFVRYIPVPAFVPLLLVWFGVGTMTKSALIFVGTYFQLVFLFHDDLVDVPGEYREIGLTLGLRRFALFRRVDFWAALPGVLDSARIAFAWAWSYLLVAEVVNSSAGIGFLVMQAYRRLAMAEMLALLIVIGLFGLGADFAFRLLRRVVCPWTSAALAKE